MSVKTRLKPSDVKPFTERSNLLGTWLVLFNWCLIILAFAMPIVWFHPVSILAALVLMANRQLGLSILMHECAHSTLFESRPRNQWVGKYLCAAPVIIDLDGYRKYHMRHHKEAGTTTDPDYPNYQPYPVSKASMARKIFRDLTGITGAKQLYATLLMSAGVTKYELSYKSDSAGKALKFEQMIINLFINLAPTLVTHLILWGVLYALGYGWNYGLWWLSYFTFFMLFLRLRNAAEHGAVPDLLNNDPLLHARTARAGWLARLSVAPNYVNYHMEHHLRPNVPCYQLPKFHRYLHQQGLLASVSISDGYISVLKDLVTTGELTQKT